MVLGVGPYYMVGESSPCRIVIVVLHFTGHAHILSQIINIGVDKFSIFRDLTSQLFAELHLLSRISLCHKNAQGNRSGEMRGYRCGELLAL